MGVEGSPTNELQRRLWVGFRVVLGGSWDLVSKVISTFIGVISIVTLTITVVTKLLSPMTL